MVEICIYDDGETSCEQNSGGKNHERKGSVRLSTASSRSEMVHRTCGRNGAINEGRV